MSDNWKTTLSPGTRPNATPFEKILRPALAIMALALLAAAANFGFRENVAGMAAAAAPAIFCLIFVFLNRFSEVAVLGFKAKLLDQKIEQADAALEKLRDLTVVVARTLYQSLTYGNRMTIVPLEKKIGLVRELEGVMRGLHLEEGLLQAEHRTFLHYHIFDIALVVEQAIRAAAGDLDRRASRRHDDQTGADALRALAQSVASVARSVDVQEIVKSGAARQFFAKLEIGISQINFGAAPSDRDLFLALVREGATLCEEILTSNSVTDIARQYLERYSAHNGHAKRLAELREVAT